MYARMYKDFFCKPNDVYSSSSDCFESTWDGKLQHLRPFCFVQHISLHCMKCKFCPLFHMFENETKCMMPLLLQHDAWWRPQCEPCPCCLQPNHQSAYLSLIHWHHKDTNQQLTNASTHFTPANFTQTHQIVSNPMKASPKQLPSTK